MANELLVIYTYIFWILLTLPLHSINAYRILGIFPITSKSHFTVNEAIMRSLDAAGHNVTLVISFPKEATKGNYTVINIFKNPFIHVGKADVNAFSRMNVHEQHTFTATIEKPRCKQVLELPEIQAILNAKEKLYDVMFIEILIMYDCFLHLAGKLGIPVIGTVTFRSWLFADRVIGNVFNPSYTPLELSTSWNQHRFYDRLQNTLKTLTAEYFWHSQVVPAERQFVQRDSHLLGEYSPLWKATPSLVFYNSHPILLPRPMNPNAVEVGGIHLEDVKPLPEDIQQFIEGADQQHGVILFSLGSFVRADTMEPEKIAAFVHAFSLLPQRVIWKLESTTQNVSPNVLIREWIPQTDILAHRSTKAFISHCGQAGVYEAIDSGIPIVAIPLFYDQLTNADILLNLGVAVKLNTNSITADTILQALDSVINDTRYRENMQNLSRAFKDRPMSPQRTVVHWTEYVIRHNGAAHLQSPALQLNLFQYLLLDVYFCILLVCVTSFYIAYYLIKLCYRLHSKRNPQPNDVCSNKKVH